MQNVEYKIGESHTNNMLSHPRFVPNSIANKITLPNNTEHMQNQQILICLIFLRFQTK